MGLAKADDVLVVEETDAVEMLRGLGVVVLSALEGDGVGRRERRGYNEKTETPTTEVTMRIQ